MKYLMEFTRFIRIFSSSLLLLVFFTIFFLIFPPSFPFSLKVFEQMKKDLIPFNVQLIVTNPLSPFLLQLKISFLLSFFVILPYFLFCFFKYLFPALYQNEKMLILKILPISFFLFLLGCFFAYSFLVPFIFKLLYSFGEKMQISLFFSIDYFFSFIFGLILVSGFIFLLPIFIFFLLYLKLLPYSIFFRNFPLILFIFLVISAIITPDGSGISQIILSTLLVGFYFAGLFLAKIFIK